MDKQKIRDFRVDLEAAIEQVAKQHNFSSASVGTIRFSDTEITCKLRVVVDSEKHNKTMSTIFGTKNIKIGAVVEFAQNFYKVTGYTPHGHFIVKKSGSTDSKTYRISKKYIDRIKVIDADGSVYKN